MIKRCPVCGKMPGLQSITNIVPEHHKYFCGVHVSCGDWKQTIDEAEADWDRRATDEKQQESYEEALRLELDWLRQPKKGATS